MDFEEAKKLLKQAIDEAKTQGDMIRIWLEKVYQKGKEDNQEEKRNALKAMKKVAEFINDALELTKAENPNSYDEEVYQMLAEQCSIVLSYLKKENS